jgi:hypothetical protein
VISLQQCWELGKVWYLDRLNPAWRLKTADEMESIFTKIGLTGPFWSVRG